MTGQCLSPTKHGGDKKILLARDGDEPLWVAVVHDNRAYTYVAQLGEFVFNAGLTRDWLFDWDLTYEAVTADEAAAAIIDRTAPTVDGRRNQWLLESLRNEPDRLTLTDVFQPQSGVGHGRAA